MNITLCGVPALRRRKVFHRRNSVDIEIELLGGLIRTNRTAQVLAKRFALDISRPVFEAVGGRRRVRVVVLLDVGEHLVVERFAEAVEVGGARFGVRILLAQ